jgi:hypothetical protein
MFVNGLPCNFLYNICKYLSFTDIINLSKTRKKFYIYVFRGRDCVSFIIKEQLRSKLGFF